jgi:hypothetical protein
MESEYRLEIDDSVAHTGKRSLKVVGIIATGTALHAKVRHDSIPVEGGKTFTIAFWAKVDAKEGQSREVDVSAQIQDDPWPGFHSKTILLDSTDWKEYTDTFVVTSDTAETVWVGLSVAQSDVDFWIDDFRFFEGGPTDEIKAVETAASPMGKIPASWGGIKYQI